MPRPRTSYVQELKTKLIHRIQHGFYRPGARFFSNRDLAKRFGVSYQTAHVLINELATEGWLERRLASGTYIPGDHELMVGVQLVFNARGKRAASFGNQLMKQMTARLDVEGIHWQMNWVNNGARLRRDLFPVIWEVPGILERLRSHYALLLNDQPPAGIVSSYVDSLSTDDFSGGVCASQWLKELVEPRAQFAVLAGPKTDRRSVQRVNGFTSLVPGAVVCWSKSWFYEDGLVTASDIMAAKPDAVFCCNDRLAEGLIKFCHKNNLKRPHLIGFDDAPIAEKLNFSTVAIPWLEIADAAVAVIKKRLRGDTTTASRQVFAPRPVVRGTSAGVL